MLNSVMLTEVCIYIISSMCFASKIDCVYLRTYMLKVLWTVLASPVSTIKVIIQ